MGKLERKLVTPQSLLIEKTALELAAVHWEEGKSAGLHSNCKTPKAYAKKYVTNFIPLAVSILMDMLGNPAISAEQKELIYAAFMERTNDSQAS